MERSSAKTIRAMLEETGLSPLSFGTPLRASPTVSLLHLWSELDENGRAEAIHIFREEFDKLAEQIKAASNEMEYFVRTDWATRILERILTLTDTYPEFRSRTIEFEGIVLSAIAERMRNKHLSKQGNVR